MRGAPLRRAGLRYLPLLAASGLAAFLRFDGLGVPSFWLDEILGQVLTDQAARAPWWHWLTGLEREHGPVYYVLQLAARLGGTGEAAARAPAAIFGVMAVGLLWFCARAASGSDRAANAGAFLLAISPLHIYYSREARPYGLLMLLSAMLLMFLLRGSIAGALAVCLAIVYSSAVGAPLVASVAVVGVILLLEGLQPSRRQAWTLVGGAAVALALFPLLYRGASTRIAGAGFPAIDARFAEHLLKNFSITGLSGEGAGGRAATFMGVLALCGAISLLRRNRRAAFIVIGMTIFPIVISLESLRIFDHWYAVRYVTPSLIGFLVLAATGMNGIVELAVSPLGHRLEVRRALAVVLMMATLAALVRESWPNARREAFRKLDWRGVATAIGLRAMPGDIVLAAEPWSEVSLGYYLERLTPPIPIRHMAGVGVDQRAVDQASSAWLVTAGPDALARQWMCSFPLLLASPMESFRLHYAPSAAHFLATRREPGHMRALLAALRSPSLTIRMASRDDRFFGEGWADPEYTGTSWWRWVAGERATMSLPRGERTDAVIRLRALPLDHPSLPRQTLRLKLNGSIVGETEMQRPWSEYRFPVPASLWNGSVNRLEMEFGRAASPVDLTPGSQDRRQLSAAFEWIRLDDAAPRGLNALGHPPPPLNVRLTVDWFLEDNDVRRGAWTRFPASRLRRDEVQRLLGRMGLDPTLVWPALESDARHLEAVVETVAGDSGCEDNRTFVRRAFPTLYGRDPFDHEEQGMVRDLESGVSRVRLVGRLMRNPEFRTLILTE